MTKARGRASTTEAIAAVVAVVVATVVVVVVVGRAKGDLYLSRPWGGELSQALAFSGCAPKVGSRSSPSRATLSHDASSSTCTNIHRRSTHQSSMGSIQNLHETLTEPRF